MEDRHGSEITSLLREILNELREIRRNTKPYPQQILNETDEELKKMQRIRETFNKFPGEHNGTD